MLNIKTAVYIGHPTFHRNGEIHSTSQLLYNAVGALCAYKQEKTALVLLHTANLPHRNA